MKKLGVQRAVPDLPEYLFPTFDERSDNTHTTEQTPFSFTIEKLKSEGPSARRYSYGNIENHYKYTTDRFA